MSAGDRYILAYRWPDTGIWCRDEAAYFDLNACLPRPKSDGAVLAYSVDYNGLRIRIASPEKWAELQAALGAEKAG